MYEAKVSKLQGKINPFPGLLNQNSAICTSISVYSISGQIEGRLGNFVAIYHIVLCCMCVYYFLKCLNKHSALKL